MTLAEQAHVNGVGARPRFALFSFTDVDHLNEMLRVALSMHEEGRVELADALVVSRTPGRAWTVAPVKASASLNQALDALPDPLTPRERELLPYLSSRLTNRELARELYVSLNTVKTHLKHIYQKLGVASRDEAVERIRELSAEKVRPVAHPGGVMRGHPAHRHHRTWTESRSATDSKENNMSNLVVVAFDDELKADEAMVAAVRLQRQHQIDIEDAAIVVKTRKGKIKVRETTDITASKGAAVGSWWGLLIGVLLGGPLGGVLWGAGVGALYGKMVDLGVDEKFMKEVGATLAPGHSAIFFLIRSVNPEAVLNELARFDGRVLRTSFPAEVEAEITSALEKTAATA